MSGRVDPVPRGAQRMNSSSQYHRGDRIGAYACGSVLVVGSKEGGCLIALRWGNLSGFGWFDFEWCAMRIDSSSESRERSQLSARASEYPSVGPVGNACRPTLSAHGLHALHRSSCTLSSAKISIENVSE